MTGPANYVQSAPVSGPAPVVPIQPGGGWAVRLELLWGRVRRKYLRRGRPGYVAPARAARRGGCPGCPPDVIDPRDLKLCANPCGYWFPAPADPLAWGAPGPTHP